MNWLDIVLVLLLIGSAISGLMSGLIRSLFSLAGLIVGVILAGRYYITLSGYLSFISNENAAQILAFIIISLIVMIIATLLGILFTKLVSAVLLGWLNRLLGAVFSVIVGAIFIAALLAIWIKFEGSNDAITNSAIATILLDRLPLILTLLPNEFETVRQFFQ
jgi:membrane protein required for colicin V production